MKPAQLDISNPRLLARWSWRACNRLSWYDGDIEIALGMGLAVPALLLWSLLTALSDRGLIDAGIIAGSLFMIAPSVIIIVLMVLRLRTIVPSGLWFFAGSPSRVPRRYVAPAGVLFVGLAVFGMATGGSSGTSIAVGSLIALASSLAWWYTGSPRFFVLAATVQAGLAVIGAQGNPVALLQSISFLAVVLSLSGIFALVTALKSATRGPQLADVVRLLESSSPENRFLALTYVQNRLDPRLVGTLTHATMDRDPFLAELAQRALLRIWGPGVDVRLEWFLQEMGIDPQQAFAPGPVHVDEILEVHDRLLEETFSYQRTVEQSVRNALLSDPALIQILVRLADRDGPGTFDGHVAALQLLGATHSAQAYGPLADGLLSREPILGQASVAGFRGASSDALDRLLPLLDDKREWVRKRTLRAISGMLTVLRQVDAADYSAASLKALDRLSELTYHPSPVTRSLALHAAMQLAQPVTARAHELYRDASALVRSQALLLLSDARSASAPGYAIQSLRDPRACVRHAAVKAVFMLRVTSALPALIALQADPSPTVVRASRDVIQAVQGWIADDIEKERVAYGRGSIDEH